VRRGRSSGEEREGGSRGEQERKREREGGSSGERGVRQRRGERRCASAARNGERQQRRGERCAAAASGCAARACSIRTSDLIFVPPTTTAVVRAGLWKVMSCSASSRICDASSRVGEMASARTPPPVAGFSSTSIVGSRKAMVFPVPVLALAMTSKPERMTGSVCACTTDITS